MRCNHDAETVPEPLVQAGLHLSRLTPADRHGKTLLPAPLAQAMLGSRLAGISQRGEGVGPRNLRKCLCNKALTDSGTGSDASRLYLRSAWFWMNAIRKRHLWHSISSGVGLLSSTSFDMVSRTFSYRDQDFVSYIVVFPMADVQLSTAAKEPTAPRSEPATRQCHGPNSDAPRQTSPRSPGPPQGGAP